MGISYFFEKITHNIRDLYTPVDIWECLFIDVLIETRRSKSFLVPSKKNQEVTIKILRYSSIQQINDI